MDATHLRRMPKTFVVKTGPPPNTQQGEYVVVTCPKCGKWTYSVVGQKGKKCPVCRRQYSLQGVDQTTRFQTPEEACRHIQAEEAKRAGRLDFIPATGGFTPAAHGPTIARTAKKISE